MEQLARELEERQRQELERLKEEEEQKKKSKRGRRELGKEKDSVLGKKSQPGGRQVSGYTIAMIISIPQELIQCFEILLFSSPAQNATASTSNTNASTSNRSDTSDGVDKKGSTKEHPDSAVGDKDEKKKGNKVPLMNASPAAPVQPSTTEQEEAKEKTLSDSEKILAMRFKIYEASQKEITHILSNWDRVQGILVSSWSQEEVWQRAEEQSRHLSRRKSRRDRERERLEKERQEKERLEKERLERERQEKLKALEESQAQAGEGAEGSAKGQGVGVPCLDIQVLDPEDAIGKILESGKLPPAEQVKPSWGSSAEV